MGIYRRAAHHLRQEGCKRSNRQSGTKQAIRLMIEDLPSSKKTTSERLNDTTAQTAMRSKYDDRARSKQRGRSTARLMPEDVPSSTDGDLPAAHQLKQEGCKKSHCQSKEQANDTTDSRGSTIEQESGKR